MKIVQTLKNEWTLVLTHTGSFAQNSFQIDSIKSKKVAILTKNYLFFNTKINEGEIGLYFGNNEKNY